MGGMHKDFITVVVIVIMAISCRSKKAAVSQEVELSQIDSGSIVFGVSNNASDSLRTDSIRSIKSDTLPLASEEPKADSEKRMKQNASSVLISFDTLSYDLESINQGDVVVKKFMFENTGNQPLNIIKVIPDCSCTSPTWTKEVIGPGRSGQITVSYDSKEDIGKILKSITVLHNSGEGFTFLELKGFVAPKL